MPALDTLRPDRAPRATLIALALLVAVPTAAISGLAWRIVRDEQRAATMRLHDLLEARLEDARLGLEQRVSEVGRELARRIAGSARTTESLRALRRELPLVEEIFVLSPGGRLEFPPEEGASAEERAFRRRTAAIWDRAATLYEPPPAEDERRGVSDRSPFFGAGPRGQSPAPPPVSSFSQGREALDRLALDARPRGDSLLDLAERRAEGWLSWYWEDGLHLLFWRRTADGAVIGAEVDRVVLLSMLVASLPERAPSAGRITLVDAKGDVLHGWGAYRPEADERPSSTQHLAYPLDAWRLRYHPAPEATAELYGGSLALAAALGVAAVTLALALIALWLWRTSTRAMREARQRVGFVTQVSHELKTPLANIRLYAELLEEDLEMLEEEDLGPRRRLAVIVSESQRLSRLIGNILTFTKQQRGDEARRREPVAVDEVVRRTVEQFAPALEAKKVEVELDLLAKRPALAEVDGLEQVLANLIGNVEKYASGGRWLGLRTRQGPGRTFIRVADRGPGIPKRSTERIFLPFYRLSDRLDEGTAGTGIGLSIARTLVEAWGGRLVHEAPEKGRGAVFVVELDTAEEEERAR